MTAVCVGGNWMVAKSGQLARINLHYATDPRFRHALVYKLMFN